MLKLMRYLVVVAVASAFLGGSLAWAQGKGPGAKPPGWEKGEKKGWEGDAPPGLEKKGDMPPGLEKKQGEKAEEVAEPEKGKGKAKKEKRKAKVASKEKKKEEAASKEKEKDQEKDQEKDKKEAKKE